MSSRPNILLIISDQQRADTLGFRGKTPCRTPHIDRLAERGVSFDHALTPCPLCGPARTSIFTGLYPHQARGVVEPGGQGPLDDALLDRSGTDMLLNDYSLREPPVLTDRLRAAGYHMAYAGKWHLGNDTIGRWFDDAWGYRNQQYVDWCAEHSLPDGWPLNDPRTRTRRVPHMSIPVTMVNPIDPAHTNDAWITDIAIRQIEGRPKDRPFFAVCGFNGPHPPFKIPEPYYSMYDAQALPEPPSFGPTDGEPHCNRSNFYRQLFLDHGNDWGLWRKSHAVYWGFCTLIDDQVGRLVACLEREGVLDSTLVVFCSDHGEMLGQHGLWHKMQSYEEALRVPLVFSAPWISGPRRNTAPGSLLDIPSTILSSAGLGAPPNQEGIDLSPAFRGQSLPDRVLFSEHRPLGAFHGGVDWRMVTDGRLKYTWNHGDLDELYDLSRDPHELCNLARAPVAADTLAGLRRRLRHWMELTRDPLIEGYEAEQRRPLIGT